jgi:nicotine blue oxidoreductase
VTVAGLLLAGGEGRRMGEPKALLRLDGELLVDRASRAQTGGGCRPVVVVLGARAAEVRRRSRFAGAVAVVNEEWSEGVGSSLRTGLADLAELAPSALACVVTLVDLPGIGAEAVRRVATAARPDRAAVATYGERSGTPGRRRRGHPVALGRELWSVIEGEARGDTGARGFLGRCPDLVDEVPCDDVGSPDDLDTPADVAAFRQAPTIRG